MDTSNKVLEIPENFKSSLNDFARDICLTFPEYTSILAEWAKSDIESDQLQFVYSYCLQIYPQRFFDILYQNDDIFLESSEENVCFLPGLDFRLLFNATDVSQSTKQTMWKYLQLILVTIMSSVKDKTHFGETMNLFDGIEEGELQTKLTDTISNLTNFFKNLESDSADTENDADAENNTDAENDSSQKSQMPDPTGIHEHLKSLFDGKIGKLAKELADELSGDLMNIFGEDISGLADGGESKTSSQDIFKKLMKNPKKIMDLMKTVGSKLESKMKDGDISKEDIMKEASELMGKMKGMGNGKEFQEMMKNLTKNMGGLGAMAGMGKDAKFDFAGMQREMKKNSQAEKMREKLEKKRANAAAVGASLEAVGEKHYVFKSGDEPQQKSSVRVPVPVPAPVHAPINDDWLDEPSTKAATATNKTSSKKKKNKK